MNRIDLHIYYITVVLLFCYLDALRMSYDKELMEEGDIPISALKKGIYPYCFRFS